MKDPFAKAGEVLGKAPSLRDADFVGEHILELGSLEFIKGYMVKAAFNVVESANAVAKELKANKTPVAIVCSDEFEESYLRQLGNLAGALTGQHESTFRDGAKLKALIGTAEFEKKSLVGTRVRAQVSTRPSRAKTGGKDVVEVTFSAL